MSFLRPLTDEECAALDQAYKESEIILKQNIYSLLNNKNYCDDCLQETIMRAVTYIDKFMASENRAGWLIKASTYATMRFISNEWKHVQNTVSMDHLIYVLKYNVVTSDPEGKKAIIELIKKKLSRKNGEFFELIMTKNQTYRELSKTLGISESAVRSRWKRMVDEIRRLPDEVKNKLEFL